jgi:starch phosphorylase
MIAGGFFNVEQPDRYQAIFDTLLYKGDQYLLLADYQGYVETQEKVSALYQNRQAWVRHAILNVAHMGKFSSDRTIREYADNIWRVKPVQRVQR